MTSFHETIISKRLIRSGTSIGANANEAIYGSSKADFIAKLQISLKETAETEYWLRLLILSDYLTEAATNPNDYGRMTDPLEVYKLSCTIADTLVEYLKS